MLICLPVFSSLLFWASGTEANRGVPVSEQFPIHNFCFRRLNNTHQFGCSSEYNGNVGVVHQVETPKDIDFVVSEGPLAKYMVVLKDVQLNVKTLDRFAVSDRVAGVLVAQTNKTPEAFSPDDTCPNRYSSFYKGEESCQTNEVGGNQMSSALLRNFPFPIFYTNNETLLKQVANCFEQFNAPTSKYSLFEERKCSLMMYAPMNAAVDSKTCIRRSLKGSYFTLPTHFCDPLESKNVFALLKATEETTETIIIAARLDSFSLFNAMSPGADSAVSGIVSLLSVADSLSKLETSTKRTKNILFALFNGEAFDYIGSSRCVFDLLSGKFHYNLTMDNITSFIELNQLFLTDNGDEKWFAHVDMQQFEDKNNARPKLDSILKSLTASGHVKNLTDSDLPVSSGRRFMRVKPDLPIVLITNFQKKFVNPFYNSIFDAYNHRVKDLKQQAGKLKKLVGAVTTTLLNMVGADSANMKVDDLLIEDLLNCYLVNSSCPRFHSVINSLNLRLLQDEPNPLYVSVSPTPRIISSSTVLTFLSLAHITGQVVDNVTTAQGCFDLLKKNTLQSFTWMFGDNPTEAKPGICVQHLTSMAPARSPAFDEDDDYEDVSDNDSFDRSQYSTWTESVWSQPEMTLFIQASGRSQMTALVFGFVILVTSFALSILIYRKSDEIFEDPCTCQDATTPPVAC